MFCLDQRRFGDLASAAEFFDDGGPVGRKNSICGIKQNRPRSRETAGLNQAAVKHTLDAQAATAFFPRRRTALGRGTRCPGVGRKNAVRRNLGSVFAIARR